MFVSFIANLVRKLLPSSCLLCSSTAAQDHNICTDCIRDMPILPQHCLRCARFLLYKGLCGNCLQHPPSFERLYALFPYQTPIIQLITKLKFKHGLSVARAFGLLLTEQIRTQWYIQQPLPDLIIPIPLHYQRLRERGFNQALEIAKPIAKRLQIPIDSHNCIRHKATAAQTSLRARERQQNMINAFTVKRDYSGLSLAIVDDVVTTGHTVHEFCKTLKLHGARQITVWCCARRG